MRLRLDASGRLWLQSPTDTSPRKIRAYLGVDRLHSLTALLPLASDPVVADLHQRWGGLSLLQQPQDETLLSFICSANKQIVQIRRMLQALAEACGDPIGKSGWKALPTWKQLAEAHESDLRACGLGYRARQVKATAGLLADQPDYLNRVAGMNDTEARRALLALPGVGPKVADCILLFGFGRTGSFPVDTWIARLMAERYPELSSWSRDQIATFGRIHFGQAAGLAQQWLFAERRSHWNK